MSSGPSASTDRASVRLRIRRRAAIAGVLFGKALAIGVVAGMAMFTYVSFPWAHSYVERWWLLVLLAGAGSANAWLVDELHRGMSVSLLAAGIAFVFHGLMWASPLVLTDYHPMVSKVLVLPYLGQAVMSAIYVFPLVYFGGYFFTLLYASTIGY